jgi:hypothetical protein
MPGVINAAAGKQQEMHSAQARLTLQPQQDTQTSDKQRSVQVQQAHAQQASSLQHQQTAQQLR